MGVVEANVVKGFPREGIRGGGGGGFELFIHVFRVRGKVFSV